MLKLNAAAAFKAYWYMFTSQMQAYGRPALALGAVCYVLTGMRTIETLLAPPLFVAALAGGVCLFMWIVGMVSDLFFLVLKTSIWCTAYALSLVVNPVLRWWKRPHESEVIAITENQAES